MALVRKILETTIHSGGSSATFTDNDIPNSLIRVYSTNSNIYPQNISLAGNTLTVTYEAVTSALGVAVELVKQGLEIDDNLTSENTDHALSAKQGKVLKGLIDNIPDDLSELSDVDITDIEDGQVLAWNETAQKFVNVDQSGGSGGINYSLTEQNTGLKWVDGKDIYQITIYNATPPQSSEVRHGVPNIDKIIEIKCDVTRYNYWHSDNFYFDNNTRFTVIAGATSYYCVYSPYNAYTNLYLTLRYTKITD